MAGLYDQVTKIIGGTGNTTASVTSHGSKGAVAVEILDASGNQISLPSGLVSVAYDSITVNYTTATKDVLSSVLFKSGVTTVATITVTYPSTTQEVYTKT